MNKREGKKKSRRTGKKSKQAKSVRSGTRRFKNGGGWGRKGTSSAATQSYSTIQQSQLDYFWVLGAKQTLLKWTPRQSAAFIIFISMRSQRIGTTLVFTRTFIHPPTRSLTRSLGSKMCARREKREDNQVMGRAEGANNNFKEHLSSSLQFCLFVLSLVRSLCCSRVCTDQNRSFSLLNYHPN